MDQQILSGRGGECGRAGQRSSGASHGGVIESLFAGVFTPAARTAALPQLLDAKLNAAVVDHVIPRLRFAPHARTRATAGRVLAADVAELTRLLVENDALAPTFVQAIRARGVASDDVLIELLSPAARRLQWLWEQDRCDFVTTTIALGRLQSVLRGIAGAMRPDVSAPDVGERSAILVAAPCEQHTFGLDMLAAFFRRAGWRVTTGRRLSAGRVAAAVRREAFALIGFTAATDQKLDALTTLIRSVRRASRNQGIGVMVGGAVFIEHPEYVALVGADATAADGRQAVARAERLLNLISRPV